MVQHLIISKDAARGAQRFKVVSSKDNKGSSSGSSSNGIKAPLLLQKKRLAFDDWFRLYRQYVAHVHAYLLWHLTSYDSSFAVSCKDGEDALFASLARYIYEHSTCADKDYKFFK